MWLLVWVFHWLRLLWSRCPCDLWLNHKYILYTLIGSSQCFEIGSFGWEIIKYVNAVYFVLLPLFHWLFCLCFFLQSYLHILIIYVGIGCLRQDLRGQLCADTLHEFGIFLLLVSESIRVYIYAFLFCVVEHLCPSCMEYTFTKFGIYFRQYLFGSVLFPFAI